MTELYTDINKITANLQLKADKDLSNVASNIDYIVESYSDDNFNWYEIFRSGKIRQGGYYTSTTSGWESINLLQPMENNKYAAQATLSGVDNTTKIVKVGNENNNTESQLKIFLGASGYGCRWEVEGKGASE